MKLVKLSLGFKEIPPKTPTHYSKHSVMKRFLVRAGAFFFFRKNKQFSTFKLTRKVGTQDYK
jgi:hypothetical protein